jgi:phage gp36-like protein
MAYCAQADLEEQISPAELIELTDDAGAGAVDATVVARAVADADAEIDSYCGALYTLHTRRSFAKAPEERQKRYDNAIRFLRDVSKGLISLGADEPARTDTSNSVEMTGNDRIFTRDKMQGF